MAGRATSSLDRANVDLNTAPAQKGGRTALQAAAEGGHIDIVERLLLRRLHERGVELRSKQQLKWVILILWKDSLQLGQRLMLILRQKEVVLHSKQQLTQATLISSNGSLQLGQRLMLILRHKEVGLHFKQQQLEGATLISLKSSLLLGQKLMLIPR